MEIISSNFFLYYQGKEALPLNSANKPVSLTDTPDSANYDNFLNQVNVIYASQQRDGTQAIFFKEGGTISSSAGLTSLEPNTAYQVVSAGPHPLIVPAIGGLSVSESDVECPSTVPVVTFSSPTFILESAGQNYQYLNIELSALEVGTKYEYQLEVVKANWPVKIMNKKGSFTPGETKENIFAYALFSPTETIAAGDIEDFFPFDPDPFNNEAHARNNLYAIVKISVSPISLNSCSPVTDTIAIRCQGCLPQVTEYYPVVKYNDRAALMMSKNCDNAPVPVVVDCSNFEKGKKYKYTFSLDNTVSTITPSSGHIGFGDGTGQITSILNLQGESPAILKIEVEDEAKGWVSTDFLSVEATDCE